MNQSFDTYKYDSSSAAVKEKNEQNKKKRTRE